MAKVEVEITQEELTVEVFNVSRPLPNEAGEIGALSVARRLNEFDTAQAKAEARQNLELQYIDGGTF